MCVLGWLATWGLGVMAQTSVLRVLMDRDSLTLPPPAKLWIVEAKGDTTLSLGFTELLQSESIRAFQVPLQVSSWQDGRAKDLIRQLGLSPHSHWALVDASTQAVLSHGDNVPTWEAFLQDLQQAGFRDRAKDLQAYLKRNPNLIEAHEGLLNLLRARGEAATQQDMDLQVSSAKESLEQGRLADWMEGSKDPAHADLSGGKKLNPVQDLLAWSAFTQEFDAVFRSGQWREMAFTWTKNGHPVDGASPTLQGLYLRWLPTVEAALREEPTSENFWDLWIWMSQTTGGSRLGPLLASLRPSPLLPKAEWPPQGALRILLATAKTPSEWGELKDHYRLLWDTDSHNLKEPVSTLDTADDPLLVQDWTNCFGPLLECTLRSGRIEEAEGLVREVMQGSRWSGIPARAAEIAARCGQRALALKWAALRGGSGR